MRHLEAYRAHGWPHRRCISCGSKQCTCKATIKRRRVACRAGLPQETQGTSCATALPVHSFFHRARATRGTQVLQSHALQTFCCAVLVCCGCHVVHDDTWLRGYLGAQRACARASTAPPSFSCLLVCTRNVRMVTPEALCASRLAHAYTMSHSTTATLGTILAGTSSPPPCHNGHFSPHAPPHLGNRTRAHVTTHTCCHVLLV